MNQLLDRARQGDKAAERQLFEFLLLRFRAFAKLKLNEDVADDIAHDACLTILEKVRSGFTPDDFDHWAHGVLRNKIGNYYRHRDIQQRFEAGAGSTDQLPEDCRRQATPLLRKNLLDCMRVLIKEFPVHARVLNLVYQGYDTVEISHRLKLKPGYVYSILSVGRRLLRECMREKELQK